MNEKEQSLQELQQIKKMMERSSKFISLSGLSGISAGVCALIGAWVASQKLNTTLITYSHPVNNVERTLQNDLFIIALLTFFAAFITSFLFTYIRSGKNGTTLWGTTTLRLFWNMVIPLFAGGLFLIRSMQLGQYELIASGCLIFYGLALVNASKYTLGEVRYLGYGQIILGIINLWIIGYGLYFWVAGFGLLHIVYGILMWYKYERNNRINDEQ